MKKVYFENYGGPEVLTVGEADIPMPGQGEVLIKMAAAGVSKPDWLMRTGAYPWTKGMLPFYPGLYGAGTITSCGSGVKGFSIGDTVFVDHPVVCGCYSEYKTAPVKFVTKIPDNTNLEYAAVMSNFIIAWSLLRQGCSGKNGASIYMKGAAGALGSAVVQLAPHAGFRIIASASSDEKCNYLREIGADAVFNYRTDDECAQVLAATDGHGADIILDQLAGEKFTKQLEMLSDLGEIIIYNYIDGIPKENLLETMIGAMARCQAVRVFSFHLNDDKPEVLKKIKEEGQHRTRAETAKI